MEIRCLSSRLLVAPMLNQVKLLISSWCGRSDARMDEATRADLLAHPGWLFIRRHLLALMEEALNAQGVPETHAEATGKLEVIYSMLNPEFLSERVGTCNPKDVASLERVIDLFTELNQGETKC